MEKRILVAGGSGLAGRSVLGALARKMPGTHVTATYNETPPDPAAFPGVTWVKADLTTREGCAKAAKGCKAAIMTAAKTGGIASALADPGRQVTDNLVMDALLLEAFQKEGISRVVYVSSATVYQDMEGAVTEEMLNFNADPHPAYFGIGWAKRAAEKLCRFWHEKYGMEVLIARSSNIYGPYAKFDPATANFIPALVRKAVDAMDPFEVWGSPDVKRDAIFSDDFGDAVVAIYGASGIKFDVFNLGYGRPLTVGAAVEAVTSAAGHRPSKILYTDPAKSSAKSRVLDCSRINDIVGWRPAIPPEEGIRRTVEWWRLNRSVWKK